MIFKKNINSDKLKIINLDLPFKDPFKFNRIKLQITLINV